MTRWYASRLRAKICPLKILLYYIKLGIPGHHASNFSNLHSGLVVQTLFTCFMLAVLFDNDMTPSHPKNNNNN